MSEDQNDACCLIRRPVDSADQLDQVAIITGSASGVGLGTALAFAKLNWRLVLVDSDPEQLAEAGKLCAQESSKGHRVSFLPS